MKAKPIALSLPLGLKPEIYDELQDVMQGIHSSIKREIEHHITQGGKKKHRIAKAFITKLQIEIAANQIDFRLMVWNKLQIIEAAKNTANTIADMVKQEKYDSVSALLDNFYSHDNSAIGIPKIYLSACQLKTLDKKNWVSPVWWRKIIHKTINQNTEALASRLQLVGRYNSYYVSDYVLEAEQHKDYVTEKYLKAKRSKVKRNKRNYYENLCFLNGIKKYAALNNMLMVFITITVPPHYHMGSTQWNGSTPKQTNDLISSLWHPFNVRIRKWKTPSYSFRIVEPHKDGTPHWHVILWLPKGKNKVYKKAFFEAFDLFYDNKQSIRWNLKQKKDDISKIIFYALKSLEVPTDTTKILKRTATCSKFWQIRRWQIVGLPKICKPLWRLMFMKQISHTDPFNNINNGIVEELRTAVKSRNFMTFLKLCIHYQDRIKFEKIKKQIVALIIDNESFPLCADVTAL